MHGMGGDSGAYLSAYWLADLLVPVRDYHSRNKPRLIVTSVSGLEA